MQSQSPRHRFRTRAVHAGQAPDPVTGAIATTIQQTTAFGYGTLARGAAIFAGTDPGYRYSRYANPTVAALEHKIADLEAAGAAAAFASGTAAVAAVITALLARGDELVCLGPLYGGTESMFRSFSARVGIRLVDATDAGLAQCLSAASRLVWVEPLTNPTLRVHDLAAIAALAREAGVVTVADSTFCTPCLTRPLEHGIDLVLHSMTKYIGGHGDASGGIVCGRPAQIERIRATGGGEIGGSLSPHDAALLLRGAKTLPLRMAAHCDGAARVAAFLAEHPAVARTHYPGLPQHPQHELASRQMRGGYGGIVSFELATDTRAAAAAFLDRLRLFTQAVSLGDADSLACHPASTTHAGVPEELRRRQGIGEGLVRLSVGIEDPEDLAADLGQALAGMRTRAR